MTTSNRRASRVGQFDVAWRTPLPFHAVGLYSGVGVRSIAVAAVALGGALALLVQPEMPYVLGLVVIAAAVAGTFVVRTLGRAWLAVEVRGVVPEPPEGAFVFYARTFDDDDRGSFYENVFERCEPRLLRHAERLGEICLVEAPKRRCPRDVIGRRFWITTGDWKEPVKGFVQCASHIVAQAGKNKGFWEEVEIVCSEKKLGSTIIIQPDPYLSNIPPHELDLRWHGVIKALQTEHVAEATIELLRESRGQDVAGVFWSSDGSHPQVVHRRDCNGLDHYDAVITTFIKRRNLKDDLAPPDRRLLRRRLLMGAAALVGLVVAFRLYRGSEHTAMNLGVVLVATVVGFVSGLVAMDRSNPAIWRYWKVLRGRGRLDDAILLCFFYWFTVLNIVHGGA